MTTFKTRLPKLFDLPKRIERLGELAYNLWWTWQPETGHLFGKLDYEMWERLGHNPIITTQLKSCARSDARV